MRRRLCALVFVPAMLLAALVGGCSGSADPGSGQLLAATAADAAAAEDSSAAGSTLDADASSSTSATTDAEQPNVQPTGEEYDSAMQTISVTVNGTAFTATLEDTEAARALAELLPMTYEMSELNGNEKYIYLDERLPTDAACPGRIEAGDIMLYGSNCLVLFYQSFNTSYSYTRIGHIDDASGLAAAAGSGSATVVWE